MLQRLFVTKSSHIGIQLFRYTFVAGIGLLIDFGVLYLLTSKLGVYYLISATISFLLALAVNYALSVAWIFESSRERMMTDLFVFGVIGAVGLLLNLLLIWIFTAGLKIYYLESKVISTIIVYLWNFMMRRYFLFNGAKKPSTP